MLADIRLINVHEYHKMVEAGILDPEERVELIDGHIINMAAKGTAHASATTRTSRRLRQLLGEQVLIRLQEPIRLNDYSEPEPDIAVVQPEPFDYADHHPTVSEVYFVIEVADSTLKKDCGFKAKAYARSGILDYWVLDVVQRELHLFREPDQKGYQYRLILAETAMIAPLQFPTATTLVSDLLPKIK
ncbi:Uma2 family endonuclease [Leptothermofonsia sichuanensis E412]|uniref:Uma2 family endonuclease n=1 Tax=Leptothermofonsia sichuanensis TaxID=2917832 RepID=UPI001CA627CA|nr:Uma2 family endonuclease [Leptothermofonsia sichuanensis]QZZ23167.1 Uma2 family endonuclease [Leptothermofonsia sichuanensis E412]